MLIGIVLMQSVGALLVLNWQQYHIHIAVNNKINTRHTKYEEISLTPTAYQQAKLNNNEVVIKGKLYDVKTVQQKGNTIVLTVLKDSDEENVLLRFCNCIKKNKSENKNTNHSLTNIFSVYDIVNPNAIINSFIIEENSVVKLLKPSNSFPLNYFSEVPIPPPQLV